MTPIQITRIQKKIKKYRAMLASERAKFGCYDDSAGKRYIILGLFISIDDYNGALIYLLWFFKNFPDDAGFPFFWVEACMTYYYNNTLPKARTMAFNAYKSNLYIWEVFFQGNATKINNLKPGSNWEGIDQALLLPYRASQEKYSNFAAWLKETLAESAMQSLINEYLEIKIKLDSTPISTERTSLVNRLYALEA